MDKLIWIIGLCFIAGCTNWPPQGYYDEQLNDDRDYSNLQLRYEYLNLHYEIALKRGAVDCVPAFIKRVKDNKSRVLKSIYFEELRHSRDELSRYEVEILKLILALNKTSTRTRCATHQFNSELNPVVFQFDSLLSCKPSFIDNAALVTSMNQACLTQVGLLLIETPDVQLTFYNYVMPHEGLNAPPSSLDKHVDYSEMLHDMSIQSTPGIRSKPQGDNQSYKALILSDADDSQVFMTPQQVKLDDEYVPDLIITTEDVSFEKDKAILSEEPFTVNNASRVLYNTRIEEVYTFLTGIAGHHKVRLKSISSTKFDADNTALINTIKLHKPYVIQSKRDIKNWRFIDTESRLQSNNRLPEGFRL